MSEKHGTLTAGIVEEKVKVTNPVNIQDLTFRDAHQSIFATRGRTEDMIPVAEKMDQVGFWALGVWGGATFDTMHRFLGEDPWERPRTLKKYVKNTPLQMLLRGQNLVGYRNYADDVAEAFVERAAENGIDVFRVFDAVNDLRNFETVVPVIKKMGKHFQGAICYSLTEPRMGGPVYNTDYYVNKAKQLEDMGADTVCIKDMAGLISPYDAHMLIKALKAAIKVPIHLHSHFTSGQSCMALLKAIEAGVDFLIINTDGWVEGEEASAYKNRLVSEVGASAVVGMQRGDELAPILDAVHDAKVFVVDSPQLIQARSREKRKLLRELSYKKYLKRAKTRSLSFSWLKVEDSLLGVGGPLPRKRLETLKSMLGTRIVYSEETVTAIFVVLGKGKAVAEEQVEAAEDYFGKRVKVMREGEEAGLLVGLIDEEDRFLGIGILDGVDYRRSLLKVYTPVSEKVHTLCFGQIKLDKNCREIGLSTVFSSYLL